MRHAAAIVELLGGLALAYLLLETACIAVLYVGDAAVRTWRRRL